MDISKKCCICPWYNKGWKYTKVEYKQKTKKTKKLDVFKKVEHIQKMLNVEKKAEHIQKQLAILKIYWIFQKKGWIYTENDEYVCI